MCAALVLIFFLMLSTGASGVQLSAYQLACSLNDGTAYCFVPGGGRSYQLLPPPGISVVSLNVHYGHILRSQDEVCLLFTTGA